MWTTELLLRLRAVAQWFCTLKSVVGSVLSHNNKTLICLEFLYQQSVRPKV